MPWRSNIGFPVLEKWNHLRSLLNKIAGIHLQNFQTRNSGGKTVQAFFSFIRRISSIHLSHTISGYWMGWCRNGLFLSSQKVKNRFDCPGKWFLASRKENFRRISGTLRCVRHRRKKKDCDSEKSCLKPICGNCKKSDCVKWLFFFFLWYWGLNSRPTP
jgi:hypothetical protein